MVSAFEPFVFITECPSGHATVFERDRAELLSSLDQGRFRLYCARCLEEWAPAPELEERLRDRLRSERYMCALQDA